jgi:hypothetical protein
MSAIANLVAFDGASTPISHTLIPISVTRKDNEVTAVWREMLASVPAYAQVRNEMKISNLKSGNYRTDVKSVVPVMEAISGQNAAGYTAAPKVAYENTLGTTGFFAPRSDVTGRRLVRQLHVNILNGITTTVAATTTGPAPELIDQLVAPT